MRFSDWSSDVCSSDLLALLEAEGLVTRKQGRGTFVTGSPEERHWFGLATSWDALIRIIEGTQPRLLHLAEGVRLPPVAESEGRPAPAYRSEERTSELQSLMRISYAVFCLKKKNIIHRFSTF